MDDSEKMAMREALLATAQMAERLREALSKYGRHAEWCIKANAGPEWKCDCGFSAALEGAPNER